MTALAAMAGGAMVLVTAPPLMSSDLAYRVTALVEADGITRGAPSAGLRTEARLLLPAYEARVARAGTQDEVELWLLILSERGPRRAPEGGAWQSFVRVVGDACGDPPAGVWGDEAMRLAVRTFLWFPTPAELDKLLRPIARRMVREADALRELAKEAQSAPAAPLEPRITPENARAVLDKHGMRPPAGDAGGSIADTPLPVPSPGIMRTIADHRAELRKNYEKMSRSANPLVAEQGRIALAKMDAAAARARREL